MISCTYIMLYILYRVFKFNIICDYMSYIVKFNYIYISVQYKNNCTFIKNILTVHRTILFNMGNTIIIK